MNDLTKSIEDRMAQARGMILLSLIGMPRGLKQEASRATPRLLEFHQRFWFGFLHIVAWADLRIRQKLPRSYFAKIPTQSEPWRATMRWWTHSGDLLAWYKSLIWVDTSLPAICWFLKSQEPLQKVQGQPRECCEGKGKMHEKVHLYDMIYVNECIHALLQLSKDINSNWGLACVGANSQYKGKYPVQGDAQSLSTNHLVWTWTTYVQHDTRDAFSQPLARRITGSLVLVFVRMKLQHSCISKSNRFVPDRLLHIEMQMVRPLSYIYIYIYGDFIQQAIGFLGFPNY